MLHTIFLECVECLDSSLLSSWIIIYIRARR